MKQTYFCSQINLMVLTFLFVTSGCTTTALTVIPTNTISPGYASVQLTTTLTPTSTSMPSVSPTETLVPSPVASTLLPTPSSTIVPTLLPDKVEELVQDLLQNNAGCHLPCWWGAIPDQTTWQTVEPFLASFASQVVQLGNSGITTLLATYEVHVKVSEHIHPAARIRLVYTVQEGIISEIGLELGNSQAYSLPQVLTVYGPPTEVWLNTYNRSRENSLPFRVELFYPEQGFVVEYYDEADEIGDQISGCLLYGEPQEHPFLFLWSPERKLVFREVLEMSGQLDEGQFYLPVQEATKMNIETFYEVFKNPDNTVCLETPANLWPSPG